MTVRNNVDLPPVDDRTFCELLAQCEIRELASRIGNAVVDFFTYIVVQIAEGITWACKTIASIFCSISDEEAPLDPSLLEPLLPPANPPNVTIEPPPRVTGAEMREVSKSEADIETERKALIPILEEQLIEKQVEAIYDKISANRNNRYKSLPQAQIWQSAGKHQSPYEVAAFSENELRMLTATLDSFKNTALASLPQSSVKYAIKSVVCLDKTLENEAESTANLEIAQKYCAYGAKYLTNAIESLESTKKIVLENLIRDSDYSMYQSVAERVVTYAIEHPEIQLPRYFNQKDGTKPLLSTSIGLLRIKYDEKLYKTTAFTLQQANPAFAASMQVVIDRSYGVEYMTKAIESLESMNKNQLEALIRNADSSMSQEVAQVVVTYAIEHPEVPLPHYFAQIHGEKPLSTSIELLRTRYEEKLYRGIVFTIMQENPAFAFSMQVVAKSIKNTPAVPETPSV